MVAPPLMITGAALAMVIVVEGAGEGVTSTPAEVSFTVRVMVPATVPVCTRGAPVKTAEVVPAGTWKLTVPPPVVNCTAGSAGRPEAGVNRSVTCPVISSGYVLPRLIPRVSCVAGEGVLDNPEKVTAGPGGTPTVMVNDFVPVWPPPVTDTVKLNVPGADGVPLRAPVEVLSVIPAGNAPAEIDHVYGVVPPVAASVWL
jgi:hypothetical protein